MKIEYTLVLGSLAAASLLAGCTISDSSYRYRDDRPVLVREDPRYVAPPPPPGPVVYQPVPYPQPSPYPQVAPYPQQAVVLPPPPPQPIIVREAPPQQIVVVRNAPPVPIRETIPRGPGGGAVWMPGYWAAGPGGWVWVSGRWNVPPRPGAVWVEPRWEQRGTEYHFSGGAWR